jgi:hypothetical protein
METTDMTKLVEALRSGKQAHEDGVMVIVSRQVCEEAAAEIERLRKIEARYKWLATKHWVEREAEHYLGLPETETNEQYLEVLGKAIDRWK